MIASVEEQQVRRLAALDGRDSVNVQHQLLLASFVSIEPDAAPLFAPVQAALTPSMFSGFKRQCVWTTTDQLGQTRARGDQAAERSASSRGRGCAMWFDVETALAVADSLAAALRDIDRF
jgi:hypothetical protein